jgi:hypothetical protein
VNRAPGNDTTGRCVWSRRCPAPFGDYDAVISKFDPTLHTLLASTFVGGDDGDGATAITIEVGAAPGGGDYIVVAGTTRSGDDGVPPPELVFPTTAGAFDEVHNGSSDLFVLRMTDDLSTLVDSTLVGGSHVEDVTYAPAGRGPDLAIDDTGNIYVAGTTYSSDFPIIPPGKDLGYSPYQDYRSGDDDVFVVKLSNDLTNLLGWTFLGGSLDASVHVAGFKHQEAWAVCARTAQTQPYDIVEVHVTGWSEEGSANDQFYPVFYNDPGYVDSFDFFADNDDLFVTSFSFSMSLIFLDDFEAADTSAWYDVFP